MTGWMTIGVDPGAQGACGILNADGSYHSAFDLPIAVHTSLKWVDGQNFTSALLAAIDGRLAHVVIERASSRPGQGVSGVFGYGTNFGSILSAVQILRLPLEFVGASQWKTALRLGRDKHASLHKARLMFPLADLSLAKHHNRAEALLIASYAMRHLPMPVIHKVAA